MTARDTLDHLLRHDYGRVVASLMREFGANRLASIEDALGQALVEALAAWTHQGVPPSPRAWLHRAARHRLIDELRKARRNTALPADLEGAAPALHGEHADEVYALFTCAHPSIPLPSQLVFSLRTLAGFSTKEIATRLVTTEANVQKRFERARLALQNIDIRADLTGAALLERRDDVLRMLYVLFTEGYFVSTGAQVLRLDLCTEAIRLTRFVVGDAKLTSPNAEALLALFHLHHGRRDARIDTQGRPVPLEAQDRSRYRLNELGQGLALLQRASAADDDRPQLPSRYHLEAAIAAEHAFASTFEETRWHVIVSLYARLCKLDPSPLHALHAAIAISYAQSPEAGLAWLGALHPTTWLAGSHLWLATHADLHARAGHLAEAQSLYDRAMALAPPMERDFLRSRCEQRLHQTAKRR